MILNVWQKIVLEVVPGHAVPVEQAWLSWVSPVHGWPSLAGAGLSQALVLVFVPSPQVTEQLSQFVQSDNPPSTVNKT